MTITAVTATRAVTGAGTYLATATCPGGSVVVGGGTETQGFYGIIFDDFPSKTGDAGTWTGQASAGLGDRGSLRVTVLCATGATAATPRSLSLPDGAVPGTSDAELPAEGSEAPAEEAE